MNPPPRDFTSPLSALELNQQRISLAIREGVPGTAMSGWKPRLSEAQIIALTDFIRTRFMLSARVETKTPGSRIYADFCSVCHGDTGKGAVWATEGLSPSPVDFTDKKIQASLSREHMINSVSYGKAETAMTGWKSRLTDDQINTVVDYVINSFMSGSPVALASKNTQNTVALDSHEGHAHTHDDLSLPFPDDLQGNLSRGMALYTDNCSTCHGEEGDGRGPRAYFINPKPRNFLHTSSRANLNRPALFKAVSKGRLRTEMPAWEKVFNQQQIADVSEYVFNTFINP
jgi:mono/diheme cytochrome c family protein